MDRRLPSWPHSPCMGGTCPFLTAGPDHVALLFFPSHATATPFSVVYSLPSAGTCGHLPPIITWEVDSLMVFAHPASRPSHMPANMMQPWQEGWKPLPRQLCGRPPALMMFFTPVTPVRDAGMLSLMLSTSFGNARTMTSSQTRASLLHGTLLTKPGPALSVYGSEDFSPCHLGPHLSRRPQRPHSRYLETHRMHGPQARIAPTGREASTGHTLPYGGAGSALAILGVDGAVGRHLALLPPYGGSRRCLVQNLPQYS